MTLRLPQLFGRTGVEFSMHCVWFEFDVKPGGHGVHEALPGTGAMKPSGQVVQDGEPGDENVPARHGVQKALPGSE
jgi:hypothetical protein